MGNFIQDYKDYASEATDSPPIYHEFAALATLAAAAGNRLYLQRGHLTLRPNLYIVLIGKSSKFRKSTSLFVSRDLVRNTQKDLVMPDDFSIEAIIEMMSKSPSGILYYPEFLGLMKKAKRDYTSGLKSFLTEIYDCPETVTRALKAGKKKTEEGQPKVDIVTINNPCISILAASTQKWFIEELSEDDFHGGFIPRFCLVPARKDELLPESVDPTPRSPQKRQTLLDRLTWVNSTAGEMTLEDREHFRTLYLNFSARFEQQDEDIFEPYIERLKTTAIKFAMLRQLGEEVPSKTISRQAMEYGFGLATEVATRIAMVRKTLVFSPYERTSQKILDYLASGPKKQSEIYRMARMSDRELLPILGGMLKSETIVEKRERANGGRPALVYSLPERNTSYPLLATSYTGGSGKKSAF